MRDTIVSGGSGQGALPEILPLLKLSMSHILVCWTRYVIPRSASCDEESHPGTSFECG